jgi:hypothetical protein
MAQRLGDQVRLECEGFDLQGVLLSDACCASRRAQFHPLSSPVEESDPDRESCLRAAPNVGAREVADACGQQAPKILSNICLTARERTDQSIGLPGHSQCKLWRELALDFPVPFPNLIHGWIDHEL